MLIDLGIGGHRLMSGHRTNNYGVFIHADALDIFEQREINKLLGLHQTLLH